MGNFELARVVSEAKQGKTEAFDALFKIYQNDIYNLALREVKNPDIACDVVQECFVEIIQTIGKLREEAAFVSWMKAIAYHQCTRYYKKKDVRHETVADEREDMPGIFDTLEEENEDYIPDKAMENEDFKNTVRAFVDSLPDAQRSAVMMKYFDNLSVREISEIQGVPENTVLSRLNYGRKAIKSSVEDYEKKNNIRLHAIPFIPLFRLLYQSEATLSAAQSAAVAEGIGAATGVALGGSVGGASAVSATATATAVGAVKAAGIGLGAKIVAGVVAAAVAITVPIVAVVNSGSDDSEDALADDIEKGSIVTELTEKEIIELNRYLTEFEKGMAGSLPSSDEELFRFAYDYCDYNDKVKGCWQLEEPYDSRYDMFVTEKDINDSLSYFFGRTIEHTALIGCLDTMLMKYEDGIYFYAGAYGDEPYSGSVLSLVNDVVKDSNGSYKIIYSVGYLDEISRYTTPYLPEEYFNKKASDFLNDSTVRFVDDVYIILERGRDSKFVITEYGHFEDDDQSEINNSLIPAGCTYYVAATGETLHEGEVFPAPATGDVFKDGTYVFKYNHRSRNIYVESADWAPKEEMNGWGVQVSNRKLEEYPNIPDTLAGRPVVCLDYCFAMCDFLKKLPQIPKHTQSMNKTFFMCWHVEETGDIVIPSTVKSMYFTFEHCEVMTGNITVNTTLSDMECAGCFSATVKPIYIYGECQNKGGLVRSSKNNNIFIGE